MPDYIQDPNDSKKQIPGPLTDQNFDRAYAVDQYSMSKAPHYVVIGSLDGNVGFFLGSSASFASAEVNTSVHKNIVTASSNYTDFGAPAAGTTLNINPHAWSGSSGDVVTFVYKGGLDGHGRP